MGLLEKLGLRKDASLGDQIDEVREAWSEQMAPPSSMDQPMDSWVDEVYPDHVIVCAGGDHYSVPYTTDDAGEITFDLVNSTEVEQTWTPVAKSVVFEKLDEDRQVAFGWAYVYEKDGERVVDHSGEFIEKQDLEDAAYVFNMEFRSADEVHTEPVIGTLVESFVSTPEKLVKMGLAADAMPHGWWTGWYIPDPAMFAKIKSGEYPMLSIGGVAEREAVDA